MIFTMDIQSDAFDKICRGIKTIEIRLLYEERKNIKINDEIIFECSGKKVHTRVLNIIIKDNLKDLLENLNVTETGHRTIEDALQILNKYYSFEKQSKYDVIGIFLKVIQ